jgi:hypothetical protein
MQDEWNRRNREGAIQYVMAYSKFTLTQLQAEFGISFQEVQDTFDSAAPIEPSAYLREGLSRAMPIVLGANKEKARSEALVFPVLTEVRELAQRQISIFSGPEFNVDRKHGLGGYCDFLLARSPLQAEIQSPVVAIVEAKHEDLNAGIPQCLAAMYAAQLFNARQNNPTTTTYGVTTSGTNWRFLRLTEKAAQADLTEYHISSIKKILGIFLTMLRA